MWVNTISKVPCWLVKTLIRYTFYENQGRKRKWQSSVLMFWSSPWPPSSFTGFMKNGKSIQGLLSFKVFYENFVRINMLLDLCSVHLSCAVRFKNSSIGLELHCCLHENNKKWNSIFKQLHPAGTSVILYSLDSISGLFYFFTFERAWRLLTVKCYLFH